MSDSNVHTVARASFRLIPNCTTERKLEVPADLPGVVIFLHGVNDPERRTNRWKRDCVRG